MLGFFIGAIMGMVCLMLPFSVKSGQSIGFFDALFVAMSSICVTGLSTVNVGQTFSGFGNRIMFVPPKNYVIGQNADSERL